MAQATGELCVVLCKLLLVVGLVAGEMAYCRDIQLLYPISTDNLSIEDTTLIVTFDTNYEMMLVLSGNGRPPENVAFTTKPQSNTSQPCGNIFSIAEVKSVKNSMEGEGAARPTIHLINFTLPSYVNLPNGGSDQLRLYICAKYITTDPSSQIHTYEWRHQGDGFYVVAAKPPYRLPLIASVMIAVSLLVLSGLFSGLNIGLMSLQLHELEVISNTGTPTEQMYAKNIIPLRKLGNILLVCILLSNTAVNSTLTIIIDKISTGAIAVVVSTLCIMLIGEIIPQSICTRYSLAIGSNTRYIMWLFIALTSVLSFPLGYLLNYLLGPEPPTVVGRQQLLELIRVHGKVANLDNEEVGIISGALNFRSKVVADAMVPIDRCFLLSEDAVLDFETVTRIVQCGFSRIPVYSKTRNNVVGLLLMKDLTLVDPDDKIPLTTVINFYKRTIIKVFPDITLDKLFHEFKNGVGHLAVVIEVKTGPNGDPYYNSVGIITLEDIIEEIIQSEITDETDHYFNEKMIPSQQKAATTDANQKLLPFFHQESNAAPELSPNMVLTICQFLSTAVPAFAEDLISKTTLKVLVTRSDVVYSYENVDPEQPIYLYKHGVLSDCFTLIIEGKVEVTVGQEKILSIHGPFSYFGTPVLRGSSSTQSITSKMRRSTNFCPDYSVKVIANVLCLRIKSSLYFDTLRNALGKDVDSKHSGLHSNHSLNLTH